jgi:tetratricopeptide (TPR) repeat protein
MLDFAAACVSGNQGTPPGKLFLDIIDFLHNPTWISLRVWAALMALCFVGCAVSRLLSVYRTRVQTRREQDIALSGVGPAAHFLEAARREAKQKAIEQAAGSGKLRSVRLWLLRCHRGRAVTLALGCMCGLLSLHNYIILSNWADGDQREFLGDHIGAVLIYRKALRVDPNLRHTHLLIGESLLAAGKINLALKELNTAAKGEQEDADPFAMLGDALRFSGRLDEALSFYHKAIEMDGMAAMYHVGAGDCLERMGRKAEAESEYLKALRANGSCLQAHQQYGLMLMNDHRTVEGIAHFKKSLMINPNSPPLHYNLATAYAPE